MARGISRRAFVSSAAIAGTLAVVPTLGTLPASGAVSLLASRRSGLPAHAAAAAPALSRSRFTPFVGSAFQMTHGREHVDVVLTEVGDLTPVLQSGDEKRFALFFAAARADAPADGIRTFRNSDFGELDLFVSPVGRSADSLRYQVIVNRL